ncbi:MAG: hypothetical protein KAS17_08990 [Victivallaceae bacterium]|nr:hypothetical protein [Victivallaceae bacterium]
MLPLIFTPESENDVLEAYRWHEKQCAGLGEEFILCLDAVMHSISRNLMRFEFWQFFMSIEIRQFGRKETLNRKDEQ